MPVGEGLLKQATARGTARNEKSPAAKTIKGETTAFPRRKLLLLQAENWKKTKTASRQLTRIVAAQRKANRLPFRQSMSVFIPQIVTVFHILIPVEMPYLYFSTYHQNESGEQMAGTESPSGLEKKVQGEITARQGLFNTYKNSVIHQPTTLDEFYYQFASDKDSFEDRNTRNKDQVVTKYLRRGVDMEKERFWPLLRVSQLWIWTIDESMFSITFNHALITC
jgi:hypothetical protein